MRLRPGGSLIGAEGRGGHGRASVPSAISAPAVTAGAGAPESMRETVLDGGVQVLTERIPGVRSTAVGVWVRQGSAHEAQEVTGISHVLEHMVFKGTERRTALEIADSLEALGGSLDAYTSREHTSYQARVLDEHLPIALDVLADLVLVPRLDQADLDLEREVILEEIAQVEDTPDDLVFELHSEQLWSGHPYGRSILGTKESVSDMRADTLRALHADRYVSNNLVVAAAGSVDHDEFVERVSEHFRAAPTGRRATLVEVPAQAARGLSSVARAGSQTHIVFGTDAPGHAHPDRYALILLSAALGGGMSSRLFQRVREELGLCYSVFTYQSFYRSAGLVGVYVGTRPATAGDAAEAVREELGRAARDGLSTEDLRRIKQQVKGQVMLSLESTGSRLHRLASSALHDEPFLGLDDLLGRIDAVTEDDVRRVAARCFDPSEHLELRLGPGA
jgi:predicted Zn-dependent peptidase